MSDDEKPRHRSMRGHDDDGGKDEEVKVDKLIFEMIGPK